MLVATFERLGNQREPIDTVLREFGVVGISGLKPEQYAAVAEKVRALQPVAA